MLHLKTAGRMRGHCARGDLAYRDWIGEEARLAVADRAGKTSLHETMKSRGS